MRAPLLGLLLCLLAPTLVAAPAAVVPELYVAEVVVDSQAESARGAALREALASLLPRITGDESILTRSGATLIVQQARRYSQRFQYRRERDDSGGQVLKLRAHFDGTALVDALKQFGLPVWPARRAVTLIWLLAPDETGLTRLLDQDEAQGLYPELFGVAAERGAPLAFPLLDLEDQTRLDPDDLRRGAVERIREASQRYEVRHILALSLENWGENWIARGIELSLDDPPLQSSQTAANPGEALAGVLPAYVNRLARRYAVQDSGGWVQELRMRVAGIDSLARYGRVLNHLASLSPVQDVQVVEVSGSQAVFRLRFDGDLAQLEQALSLSRVLVPVERDPFAGDEGLSFHAVGAAPELHYRVR